MVPYSAATPALTIGHGPPSLVEGPVDPAPIDGRYRLERRIGSGGGGTVYLATDLVEGRQVAVKRVHAASDGARARVRREVGALRLLALPGVLRLLDEGQDATGPYLVTEYIEGTAFPGELSVPPSWDALRGPLLALLEVLAAVHEAGVIHRDIKPPNVLVRSDGLPVLLDFGLARGDVVGVTITVDGAIVGTPRYLAPEQLLGQTVDARTDLYAVGVMAYELLAGRPPHSGDSVDALWQAKLSIEPTPLWQLNPDVPRHVGDAIALMLARRPDDRPSSAAACLVRLGGVPFKSDSELRWLQDVDRVTQVVALLEDNRAVALTGRPGCGRTRLLRQVAARLERTRPVVWAIAGQRPFESIGGIVGDLSAAATAAPAAYRRALEAVLATGAVVLADDGWGLDRWSRQLLSEVGGRVCRVLPEGERPARAEVVVIERLSEDVLRQLFVGPELLLHLPSDGAHELHRRTDGVPGRMDALVRDWQRAGLCTLVDGQIAIGREAIDRLRAGLRVGGPSARGIALPRELDPELRRLLAWVQLAAAHATPSLLAKIAGRPRWQVDLEIEELRQQGFVTLDDGERVVAGAVGDLLADWPRQRRDDAHRAIALALEGGSQGRLYHLLAGGVVDALVAEAVVVARECRRRGQLGEAEAALCEALQAVRLAGRFDGEMPLLRQLARTALASDSQRALDLARYELRRAHADPATDEERRRVGALLNAAAAARHGHSGAALAALDELGAFVDADLELGRQLSRVSASLLGPPDAGQQVIDELATWTGSAVDQGDLGARISDWEGRLRYRQGRYSDAGALHEASAAQHSEHLGKCVGLLNAAAAWLAAGDLARADACAREVAALAYTARLPLSEARAHWTQRTARLRAGELLEPWVELVDAVAQLRNDEVVGSITTIEAGFAFRRGDRVLAADLARRALDAHERGGIKEARLHAASMVAAADPGPHQPWASLVEDAAACRLVEVGLECLGLLAAGPLPIDALRAAALRLLPRLDPGRSDLRMCVYTPREALVLVGLVDVLPEGRAGS